MSQLAETVEGSAKESIEGNVVFAEKHRDIVRDWGRFPHRNASSSAAPAPPKKRLSSSSPGSSF